MKSSYINPYTHQRALELIDSGRLDVSSMVYAIKGLEELEDILGKPEYDSRPDRSKECNIFRETDCELRKVML